MTSRIRAEARPVAGPVILRTPQARPASRVGSVDRQLVPDKATADRTAAERSAADEASADEASADAARARFRKQGMARLEPDECIGSLLEPGEQLVAVRHAAVRHRPETTDSGAAGPVTLDVYVTSRRLVLAGPEVETFDLASLDEASVSNERLLLVLCDGRGLDLQVDRPRLLRVEIAAARAAQR